MGFFKKLFQGKSVLRESNPGLTDEQIIVKIVELHLTHISNKWDETVANDSEKKDFVTETLLEKYYTSFKSKDDYRLAITAIKFSYPKLIQNCFLAESFLKKMLKYGNDKKFINEEEARNYFVDIMPIFLGRIRDLM